MRTVIRSVYFQISQISGCCKATSWGSTHNCIVCFTCMEIPIHNEITLERLFWIQKLFSINRFLSDNFHRKKTIGTTAGTIKENNEAYCVPIYRKCLKWLSWFCFFKIQKYFWIFVYSKCLHANRVSMWLNFGTYFLRSTNSPKLLSNFGFA